MQLTRPAVQDLPQTTVRMGFLFAGYVVLYGGTSYLTNTFVITDDLLKAEWSASFDAQRVAAMFDQRRSWILLGYAIIPATLLAKILYTSVCIWTGCAIADWSVRFSEIFVVAMQAEIIFGVAAVIQICWSLLGSGFASFADVVAFYPLSVLQLVDLDASELWMTYPLKTLNVFEVAYAAALAYGLRSAIKREGRRVLMVVGVSYGSGLLLLVSTVTFLALYFL